MKGTQQFFDIWVLEDTHRITGEKDHPWKGLARSYTHYGTNAYYRKMLKQVGFSQVKGRLLWPFLMASRFSGVRPANPE